MAGRLDEIEQHNCGEVQVGSKKWKTDVASDALAKVDRHLTWLRKSSEA